MIKKRTVAIVGFACTTLPFAKLSQADEMWTVNFAWLYDVPRIDRLFEIHPLEVLEWNAQRGDDDNYDRQHLNWLQEEHDFIVYTYADYTGENALDDIMEKAPRIPNSISYQWDIIDPIFENLIRENRPGQIYMPSTISYMIAMAIHEGFERIEVYGVEMAANSGGANGTEYVYQKAGTEALLMYAMGKGIEVYLPEHCKLMNIKPYHKGLQMITRQTLESMKKIYEQKREKAKAQTNYFRGQVELTEKNIILELQGLAKEIKAEKDIKAKNALEKKHKQAKKRTEAEMGELIKSVSYHQGMAIMSDGIVQFNDQLIASIDLDDPVVELVNRAVYDDVSPVKKQEKEKVLA